MTIIDDRVGKLETRVAVQDEQLKSAASQSWVEKIIADNREFIHQELKPIRDDISAMKNELTHKASHADVQGAINSMTWRMLGGIGFLTAVMALFKFLH